MKKQLLKNKTGNIRYLCLLFVFSCILLSGCGKTQTVVSESTEETEEQQETEKDALGESTNDRTENPAIFVTVKNPGYIYYNDGSVDNQNSSKLILKEWYKSANKITDTVEWFVENYEQVPGKIYEDEYYHYELYEDCKIGIYSLEGKLIADLDFSQFQYAEEYKSQDYVFVNQRILHARGKDGILYVATSHDTYASSCSQNGYITAVDLSDGHVIWKTDSLTCNSYNFEIIGDHIICGYGFTDEPDYLKVVDRKNGVVVEEIPVASKIDYFIRKNDLLYVRTYNTDYCFAVLPDEREILLADSIKGNVPQEIIDYAMIDVRRNIAWYESVGKESQNSAWKDVVVEQARIVGITPIQLGKIAEDQGVKMYLLEYRLQTSGNEEDMMVGGMSVEKIDGEQWLTEKNSGGSPYLIFSRNASWKWDFISRTSLEIIEQDYGSAEMIERYGDSYTANAMNCYYKKMN